MVQNQKISVRLSKEQINYLVQLKQQMGYQHLSEAIKFIIDLFRWGSSNGNEIPSSIKEYAWAELYEY